MESMLQRHCARYIYVIPDGLRELMSDISREVLRSQPEDVYTFVADYLDALMITRENARVAARLVESLTEMATTTAIFLEETGMPRDEIDNIVSAIQRTFKRSIDSEENREVEGEDTEEHNVVAGILTEIQLAPEQAEIAAIVIQQAYRRFKERKEREKLLLAGMVDWRVAARSAIHLYRKTGVTNEEANRAATLIKSAYKGYYTRKIMKKMADDNREDFVQDIEFENAAYLEDLDEGEFEEPSENGEQEDNDRQKAVTIDYNTVIPHVDFDTSGNDLGVSAAPKISTTSSIAKYSLRYIFDAALDRIGSNVKRSTIVEKNENPTDLSEDDFPKTDSDGVD
ncbi:uncharacterized protein LOC109545291 [Dendroctonus ponderosae]|uniref:RIIa domain-containing protein n=1 Tax=Dendroctonus ponderosae TaxID=77166 RepID=U4U5J7_DENPD|nr:uncharacterized protein LOC109545291 [Dendroctonus ponderosae]ERL85856.1 hypothetical protein D910_03271 [Dendroctonus ponderosae]